MAGREEPSRLDEIARELGLEPLLALDRDAFALALAAARGLAERIPRPALSDEPAHVCRFDSPPAVPPR